MGTENVREYDLRLLLKDHFLKNLGIELTVLQAEVSEYTEIDDLVLDNKWLLEEKLVIKPDKYVGDIKASTFAEALDVFEALKLAKHFIGKEIDGVKGLATTFIIEPFIECDKSLLAIDSTTDDLSILFKGCQSGNTQEGMSKSMVCPKDLSVMLDTFMNFLNLLPLEAKECSGDMLKGIFSFYSSLDFTSLEAYWTTWKDGSFHPSDMRAKVNLVGSHKIRNLLKSSIPSIEKFSVIKYDGAIMCCLCRKIPDKNRDTGYPSKDLLKIHLMVHSSQMKKCKVSCPNCGNPFRSESAMDQHDCSGFNS